MSDPQEERLRAALAERYTVERELGRGGMAVVYLARDPRHDRRVAIKVLRPELAVALGPERFLREIRVAAHLNHPHILPLHDSGEVGGFLYYVMPYVEGESLRGRLNREHQLPMDEAVRIARDVASALSYAHEHGIVHRDIKPENVLLAGGGAEAVVTDFGIARAVSAAGKDDLTGAGVAIGTPAYMSPEQASAATTLDGRSDIYSLGCLLYEMLVGHPPFTGASQQEVLVRHTLDPVPTITAGRAAVSVPLQRVVYRALAKSPADRFATAAKFAEALDAAATGTELHPGRGWRWGTRAAIALITLVLGVAAARRWWPRAVALNERVVAVLPFRVSGADPALEYLREGMIDLLAAKLTGDGGPRAVDPRTVVSAWRRRAGGDELPQGEALRLARSLGAGRALLGAVIGTPSRVVLSASLLQTSGGRSSTEASVQGPVDSLLSLVDQLAAQLLALGAGEAPQRLASATSTSLPALRYYLDGQAEYRRGQYQDAVRLFGLALMEDSTFALAALGLRSAGGWIGSAEADRGLQLAWAQRSRLSARDRAILTGLAGPAFPNFSTERAELAAWLQAVALAPDQPEAWFELGDEYYHSGDMIAADPLRERSTAAFRRAVELDSTFAAPLAHLVELAARGGDTAAVRRLGALYFATDSVGELTDYLRWRVAVALGDQPALARLRARMPTMDEESLRRIVVAVQLDGLPAEDAGRAAEPWLRASDAPRQHWLVLLRLHDLALNQGRPAEALALTDSMAAIGPSSHAHLRIRVDDALYAGGSEIAAAQAIRTIARAAAAPPSSLPEERTEQEADVCALERWNLAHGEEGSVARAVTRLRGASPRRDASESNTYNRWCATVLEALQAARTRRGVSPALVTLDSLMQTGPRPIEYWNGLTYQNLTYANLVVSQLRELGGDAAGGLAAARRRPYHGAGAAYLASFLRQEGRLAEATGDRPGAITAYRRYLALRSRPEPPVQGEVDRVRAELARLAAQP
ncbi:MAG TPA: protein kinase [Gemmatimonadales bacterium]|nr:protein kinase [Gemmatimonadales bacterium]